MTQIDNARGPDWEAPKELYFYDDWLRQNTKGRMLCGNHKYIRADLAPTPQDDPRVKALVEALRHYACDCSGNVCEGTGGCGDTARAALAAFDTTGGNADE